MVHSSCLLYDRRPLKEAKGSIRETLYVGMASTGPLSLNKCNSSEFSNAAAIRHFRHIMWPTSVSIHDNTLKGGKIHCYNDIHEIAKTPISPSSSSSSNGLVRIYLDFVSKGFLFPCAVHAARQGMRAVCMQQNGMRKMTCVNPPYISFIMGLHMLLLLHERV